MRGDRYVLDHAGRPVPEPDQQRWLEWFAKNYHGRNIWQDHVQSTRVSVAFLGVDDGAAGEPLLYEVRVFAGPCSHFERYATREQADAASARALARLRSVAVAAPDLSVQPIAGP